MRAVVSISVQAGLLVALTIAANACGSSADSTADSAPASASSSAVVQLAPENVVTVAEDQVSSGPLISGQLTPAREASVRALVGGSIVTLTVDRGQSVAGGAEVARITSRDLDASRVSAETAIRSAETALTVAKNEAQRAETLVQGGAIAKRELEQATNGVAAAEAQVAAARARARSVEQQLEDTSVRAPFAGVVSARPAGVGDVVTPGTELFTIIDPSSMRLEGLVAAEDLAALKPGAKVTFTIRGATGEFIGRVDRINPSADPVTRQVSVFVTLPNTTGKLVAGLFAEGRVETASRQGLVIPLAAVDETGVKPVVTRIRGDKAERAIVALGVRQPETERVEVTSGLAAGDVVVIGSAKNVADGTPVRMVK